MAILSSEGGKKATKIRRAQRARRRATNKDPTGINGMGASHEAFFAITFS